MVSESRANKLVAIQTVVLILVVVEDGLGAAAKIAVARFAYRS